MTFKHYDPKTNKSTWKSVNVGGFKTNGRGCKSDQFVSASSPPCMEYGNPE